MHLSVLGTIALRGPTGDRSGLTAGKPLALVASLASANGRTASRSTLLSLLWADLEPDAAKHALRQTLWYLKKKVGQDLIIAEGDTLRLADTVTVDRDELLAASNAGDHQRVVDLYAGPFIPNFAAPGSSGFEEWAALERRRLLEVFRHSAEVFIAAQLSTGRAKDAITLARRLRDQDLYNEGGWRLLIEACTSAGDTLAAKAESEALLQLAEQEEMELEPATRATLRSTRISPSTPGTRNDAPDGIQPSLVGREDAFAALLAAWESTRNGKLTRVHITAGAGIGKSRLLRELAARLRGMRSRVVSLSGTLGSREIDYALASDLAAQLATLPGKHAIAADSAATLVDLNPSLSTFFEQPARRTEGRDAMRTRTLAVRELLRAVSFEHPIAVLIDDMHWWDETSASLIAAVFEGAGDARVLLVTAGRPEMRNAPLVSGTATIHLAIEALTTGQVEELVLSIASFPSDTWAQGFAADLWRASRGSPLLALEQLQHLEAHDLLRREEGTWRTSSPDALATAMQQTNVLAARLAELDRSDMWLLTLLATGGTTVARGLLARTLELPEDDVAARMHILESRGFVVRDRDGWRLTHDEIAVEVLRMAAPEAAARAAAHLGQRMASEGELDEAAARRAMQLLRIGGDMASSADLLRRFAAHRYASGDRRPITALAAALLGSSARPVEVRALAATAPITWRLGLVSRLRRVAAACVAFAVTVIAGSRVIGRPVQPVAETVLALVFADSAGRISYETVEIRSDGWNAQDTLETEPWEGPEITVQSSSGFNVDYSPATNTLVTAQSVVGPGTIDLFLHRPGEPSRPFLSADRDDVGPAFSPDGQFVAYSTARWDTLFRYDIAVAGVSDTAPRRLTSGPGSDVGARWSPDGRRIAFARSNWGVAPNEVCVIDMERNGLTCIPVPNLGFEADPVAWLDNDRLVLRQQGPAGQSRMEILQWSTREFLPFVETRGSNFFLSPTGEWLYCMCALNPDGTMAPAVVPVSAPALFRPIRGIESRSGRLFAGAFWLRSRVNTLAASTSIMPQPVIHAGVAAQMRATLRDPQGGSLTNYGRIRWSVVGGGATIDSLTGLLVASPGTTEVRVVAAAGTAAADTLRVRVDTASARLVFDEPWSNLSGWLPFGDPQPTVDVRPGYGGVFLNNGEGSFESGAVSKASASAQPGAALDVEVRTPITLPQWQTLAITLTAADTTPFVDQAGRNAIPHVPTAAGVCAIGYPVEGRLRGLEPIVAASSGGMWARARHEGLDDGRMWRLRLQLLPDGRCGVAINGRPLGVLNSVRSDASTVRVKLGAASYNTRIEIGRLRLYEGVLTDIDWSNAPILK